MASSAGRWFDAAAALVGLISESSYEGQAAMQLEALSEAGGEPLPLPLAKNSLEIWVSDWAPLLPMLMDVSLSPKARGSLFHASLAAVLVA